VPPKYDSPKYHAPAWGLDLRHDLRHDPIGRGESRGDDAKSERRLYGEAGCQIREAGCLVEEQTA